MACPTCDATMHALGCKVTEKTFFWCPRCGTILPCEGSPAVAPELVQRCRDFEAEMRRIDNGLVREWHRLGIAESITPPPRGSSPAELDSGD